MKKLLRASLAATVAMYLWGGIFWMNPLPYKALQRVPDDSTAGEALLEHFPKSGTYMIPGREGIPEQLADLRKEGPVGMLHLQRRGRPTLNWFFYLQGLPYLGVAALLIAFFVRLVAASLRSFRSQLAVAALTGLASAWLADTTQPVWFFHPGTWHAVLGLYHFTAWFLGALAAMAFLVDDSTPLSKIVHYLQTSSKRSREG